MVRFSSVGNSLLGSFPPKFGYNCAMRKGAKKIIGSKAGHKGAVAESRNDEVMAESLEASAQEPHQSHPREEVAGEKEKENGEETRGDEEGGEKKEEEEELEKPDSLMLEDQEDEAKDASPSQQKEHNKAKEVNEDKKKPARRRGKQKRTAEKETEKKDGKKARQTKPEEEPEYLEEKRNLQDLWKAAFPVGTEWHNLDALHEFNWDFKHVEEALEEGGMLYGKKVFVFVNTEPQLVFFKDVTKVIPVPTVVVIESPVPPSDKIAITSIQGAVEEIVPMKQMKMDWVPYIPLEERERQVDRMEFRIFILGCMQRRAALGHLKEERLRKFQYCLPYFYQPFEEDVREQITEVQILFPSEVPVVCEFDWKFNKLEEFVDQLIEADELSLEQKDEFKEFVKERVRAAKKAIREVRDARMRAIDEMSEDTRQAFQSMRFYKFYPRPSPEVPRVAKAPIINRYYGKAHQLL